MLGEICLAALAALLVVALVAAAVCICVATYRFVRGE